MVSKSMWALPMILMLVGLLVAVNANAQSENSFNTIKLPCTGIPANPTHEIDVTNTVEGIPGQRGIHFVDPVFWTHDVASIKITLGVVLSKVPSPGLILLSEEGDNTLFADELRNTPGVTNVIVCKGVIGPGQRIRIPIVRQDDTHDRVSGAWYHWPLNSSFGGPINMVIFPNDVNFFLGNIHDAGTEENTEKCRDLPRPPYPGLPGCPAHQGRPQTAQPRDEPVTIHRGIFGHGNFRPEDYDWKNPANLIIVRPLASPLP